MNTCAQCSVRETAICRSLSPCQLDALNCLGQHRLIERGHTVMWEGDPSLLVGNIIEGVLKLSASTADGRDQTLGIMFPADFIGRPFGVTSSHSITALTDAKICTFTRTEFDHFARDHHALEHALLARTLDELDRTRQWMVLLARKSAGERVAAFLLDMAARLARHAPDGKPVRFELPFGRQDMADLLGLTIETVSRQMTRLRDAGVIATPSRRAVVILDKAALEACAEES
jgi:CRP/FNR family transcriptional regulator, anaerobic regulatory protein